ncbi:hypothetical protein CI102_8723 [Trichoderma harzianum]|nr:hypothetical protein CI102_8723 [Trichoderma harzianum]
MPGCISHRTVGSRVACDASFLVLVARVGTTAQPKCQNPPFKIIPGATLSQVGRPHHQPSATHAFLASTSPFSYSSAGDENTIRRAYSSSIKRYYVPKPDAVTASMEAKAQLDPARTSSESEKPSRMQMPDRSR